jgi:hypothetical protein
MIIERIKVVATVHHTFDSFDFIITIYFHKGKKRKIIHVTQENIYHDQLHEEKTDS